MTAETKKVGFDMTVVVVELCMAENKDDVMYWYNEFLQNVWKLYQAKMKECEE